MKKIKWLRMLLLILLAGSTALALSMRISIQPVRSVPDQVPLRQMTQLLMGLVNAISDNHILTLMAGGAAMWTYLHFLLKAQKRGFGEYVLSCLLALGMMFSMAVQETGSVSVLWANLTQICKMLIIWAGLVPVWLSLIRAMDAGLNWLKKQKPFAFRRPLLTPMLIMLAAWTPQALIRYPGAVIFDTVHQLQEFFGDVPFAGMNPPVHTALIGMFVQLGDRLGCAHLGFFMITVLQMIGLAWVLAWLLCVLQRLKMPAPLVWTMLACNALLPTYSAYVTTVLKDTACAIGILLFLVQVTLQFLQESYYLY